jgi:hypothetical protein
MSKSTYTLLCMLVKLKVIGVDTFVEAQIDARHQAGEFDDIDGATYWVPVSHDPHEPFESFTEKDMPVQQIALI